jgi:hypothetical protein
MSDDKLPEGVEILDYDKMSEGERFAHHSANLWFHLQEVKRKMRLQFLKDIQRMTAEGATVKAMYDRLVLHERQRRTMRDLHNMATDNQMAAEIFTYFKLIEDCDELRIPQEYKEHCLYVRPLTAEEISAAEAKQKKFEEIMAGNDEENPEEAAARAKTREWLKSKEHDEFVAKLDAEKIDKLEKEFTSLA